MDMMKLVKKTLQLGVGVSMFILAAGGLSFIPGASAAGDFVSGIYGIPYLGNVIAVAGGFGIIFGAIYIFSGQDILGLGEASVSPGAGLNEVTGVAKKIVGAV
jgi:hypothetical protein